MVESSISFVKKTGILLRNLCDTQKITRIIRIIASETNYQFNSFLMKFLFSCLFIFLSFSFFGQITLISNPEIGTNESGFIDACPCDSIIITLDGDLSNITSILWVVDDTSFPGESTISLSFCEPDLHTIQVIYIDELNETFQETASIRISTTPDFSQLLEMTNYTCQGQSINFIGGFVDENNYTGFEMISSGLSQTIFSTEVDDGEIPDNATSCFSDTLTFNFGDATISSADEINELMVNMNHTYMGDLIITYTCPNGNTVVTHQQGGGGTNLGDSQGYDYSWVNNDTTQTWVEAAANYNTLPSGVYQSNDSFENFVGCPVSGDWSIEICDVWSNDIGTIYDWGINFNMADSTTYSPTPTNAFWEANEAIINETTSGITILQDTPVETYSFVVEDNFGCSYTQEISLIVNEPIDLELENQVNLYCSYQEISIETATENCSQSNGNYEYCYGNNEAQNWLYCPDDIGDGTMMTVEFTGGFLEVNFDYIYIYDGDSPEAPLLATLNGEIENTSFTATNDSGCILVQLTSDFSINCGGNNYNPIAYSVSCGDANNYDWSWEPANLLSSPNSPNLQINEITGDNMIFTATITDPNNPGCQLIHDVVIFTENMFDIGEENAVDVCITDQGLSLYNFLNGSPSGEGIWMNENDEQVSGFFTPQELGVFNFYYTSENCQASSLVEVTVSSIPETPSIIVDGEFLITGIYNNYQWYLDGVLLEGVTSQSYTAPIDGYYSVEVFNDAGCSAISSEVFIGEETTDNINEYQKIRFNISPNPFSNQTQLLFANQNSNYHVSLYSITGNLVREYHNVKNELVIYKDNLGAGIYIIQVEDASGNSRKQRLVVE